MTRQETIPLPLEKAYPETTTALQKSKIRLAPIPNGVIRNSTNSKHNKKHLSTVNDTSMGLSPQNLIKLPLLFRISVIFIDCFGLPIFFVLET